MAEKVMVSVFMLAYNHSKYIEQAIKSVLMQKTDFRYELVIGDDASTDNTQEIIKKYATEYPDIIKVICRERNIGPLNNSIDVRNHCRGKYLACLEGDDFWTDEYKLQKQIDFLEQNKEYSLCFTAADIIKDTTYNIPYVKHDINSLEEYLNHGTRLLDIPSATMVFRNVYKKHPKLNNCFKRSYFVGDRLQHTILLKFGKFKYLNEKTATYRHITQKGTSFSSTKKILRLEDTIKTFHTCTMISGKAYEDLWNKNISGIYHELLEEISMEKGILTAVFYFIIKLSLKEKIYYLKRKG